MHYRLHSAKLKLTLLCTHLHDSSYLVNISIFVLLLSICQGDRHVAELLCYVGDYKESFNRNIFYVRIKQGVDTIDGVAREP